jgi:uncharacterized protein with LGFP repeats
MSHDTPKAPRWRRTAIAAAALLATIAGGLVGFGGPERADAVSASDFNPGLIITDELFYDDQAMTAAQIQSFLDAQIGTCLNGRCLNVATVAYPGRARDVSSSTGRVVCEAIAAGTILVSELIYRTQVACGISAKVILVTLQKEQGLVTSRSPGDWALRSAMGMACPDTAPCDSAFAGLGTQIVTGTRQLKVYKAGAFARQPGEHYITYHPNSACGGTNVTVQNFATAALYNYTPYQPNPAALANLGSVGDSCSSYGNRNFWWFYSNWFGATTILNPNSQIDQFYSALSSADKTRLGAVQPGTCSTTAPTCRRVYANGIISWASKTGAQIVEAPILAAYLAAGGESGALGGPTIPMARVEGPNGNGHGQRFGNNAYLHSSANGTYFVQGEMLNEYVDVGWVRGSLGWPTGDPVCASGAGCIQTFQFGRMTVNSTRTVANVMTPELSAAFDAAGGVAGIGLPMTGVATIVGPNGDGYGQRFAKNSYIHSSAAGVFTVQGSILDYHTAQGWVRGAIGWPIAAAQCVGGPTRCTQEFQGGTLANTTTGSVILLPTAVASAVAAAGGITVTGLPMAAPSAITGGNGSGTGQRFANNAYLHTSASGSYFVSGTMLDAYVAEGWVRGALGWPTAAASCDGTGCTQLFQYGSLRVPTSGSYTVTLRVAAQLQEAFDAAGGAAALGTPVTAVTTISAPRGDGIGQRFSKEAYIHSSSSGAFVVQGAMLNAYIAQGWVRGSLGWPAGVAACDSSGCTQQFQGGALIVPTSGSPRVVPAVENAAIKAVFDAAGGRAVLGDPTTAATTITSANGNGIGQRFATNAYIHSSASGTFLVSGGMLDSLIALGWVRGTLGWPTAAAVCDSAGCSQQFQFGTLTVSASGATAVIPVIADAAMQSAYDAAGGVDELGLPTTAITTITGPNGNGKGMRLANAAYLHSSAAGAFVVRGALLDDYIAAGWVRGALGWPTGAATCDAVMCTQTFQFGSLSAPAP